MVIYRQTDLSMNGMEKMNEILIVRCAFAIEWKKDGTPVVRPRQALKRALNFKICVNDQIYLAALLSEY